MVGPGSRVSTLDAVRSILSDVDEAIVCSAFVRRAGVHLVERQLEALRDQVRLAATTAFSGDTTMLALNTAVDLQTRVRVHNPARGTYHPKLYVGRRGDRVRAPVTSANLTGGLVSNIEVGALLEGSDDDPALRDAWATAEALWSHADAAVWTPVAAEAEDETFSPGLFDALRRAVNEDPLFLTLSGGRPNRVIEVTGTGIWIETEASDAKGRPAQKVPAWMFELAWEYLRTHGQLTNAHLVANDGLNVKRSSAVCAILARLPGVDVASTSPIALAYRG